MNGPHRLITTLALSAVLTSCSSLEEEAPPAAGTAIGPDPVATKLYAKAQAEEAAGHQKKAIKSYREIAKEHAYAESAPEAKFREANLLDNSGQLLDAFKAYDEFIQRYPGSPRYSQALKRQATVAHAAAEGHITNNFLGIKSRVDRGKTTELLAKVRANAPRSSEAPRAQFAIGQVWEGAEQGDRAIAAYEVLLDDYADTALASEAQFRIGEILLSQSNKGNRNPANLDKAENAFRDLLQRYPNSKHAPAARKRLGEIAGLDLQRSFNIAEFYFKKKQYTSASFYFREVIKQAPAGALKQQASERLAQITSLTS